MGASFVWAIVVHIDDDLVASRDMRASTSVTVDILDAILPKNSPIAVFEWRTNGRLSFLQLDRDMVVLDAARDGGNDMRILASQLLERGRRVFVFTSFFPEKENALILSGFNTRSYTSRGLTVTELIKTPRY